MASKNGKVNITLGTKYSGYGITAALKGLKDLARGATDIKSAFEMSFGAVRGVFGKIGNTLSSAFRWETQTTQFGRLIGSIDEAKQHMADLKALGDTPPFGLDEFAKASRELMVMSDGVLGYKQSLEMIGDAAAATGRPIEEMSHAVGRLFATIRDGQPISRATMELRNMGVLTPEVAKRLQDLQDAGADNAEIWGEVEQALSRYNGAMGETERTGEGLVASIKTRWDNVVRAFGQAFQDVAKEGMGETLKAMEELENSGAIERWASGAASALNGVVKGFRWVADGIGAVWDHLKAGRQFWADEKDAAQEAAESWQLYRDEQANEYTRKKYYRGSDGSERVEEIVDEAAKKAYEKRKREEERLRREKEREERERVRIAEALAEGQRRKEARDAEQAAKEDAKAWEKYARECERYEAELEKEREKAEQQRHQKRMDNLRAEISLQQDAANSLKSTANAAQSEFDRAFAMYRDPSRAASEIAEEQDYRNDLEQLHKDARRYGGKWRIDQLSSLMAAGDTQGVSDTLAEWRKSRGFSPQVEAMVRASAAEQAKNSLEDSVKQIEANTADLAAKLDELLQVKG